jgi:hypothetical protein
MNSRWCPPLRGAGTGFPVFAGKASTFLLWLRGFTSADSAEAERRTKSLDALLPVLYLRGVSAADFLEGLATLLGKDAPNLSLAVISRLTAEWQADYDAWQKRDLSARQNHRPRPAPGRRWYLSTWRIAPFGRFWQARHPPRYAAFNQTSSPRFPHGSSRDQHVLRRRNVP